MTSPGMTPHHRAPTETYGCLVAPQFAAQAAVRLRPHLAASPVVLLEGQRPHERVFAINGCAATLGLTAGMTRIEVETFDSVTTLARSNAEEQSAFNILLEALGVYTPRLETHLHGPDWECLLDLTGTERLLGDAQTLAARITAHLARLGFRTAITLSTNADAGLSVARFLAWSSTNAVEIITQPARVLAPLPLAVLLLDEDTTERFDSWGIATLGELAALPENALIARMGQAGKQLRLRARGELPHLLEPAVESLALEETLTLEEPVETLEPLLFLLNPMLEQLLLRAQERALALAAITVDLLLEIPADRELDRQQAAQQAQCFTRTIRPAVPTLNRPLLLKMLQLDLEAHPAPGSIRSVKLSAESGDTSRIQLGLFAPQMPEPTRFEDTHARLVALVGETNVGRLRPLDTHATECFILERFKLPAAGYKAPPSKTEAARPATAIRRIRPPIELRVHLRGSQITGFWFEARRFEVLRCYGPWRSSGEWWHGKLWSADTWDLAAHDPVQDELLLCLVGHDLVRNQWRMEGVYD